jgi:hypothetical protein
MNTISFTELQASLKKTEPIKAGKIITYPTIMLSYLFEKSGGQAYAWYPRQGQLQEIQSNTPTTPPRRNAKQQIPNSKQCR